MTHMAWGDRGLEGAPWSLDVVVVVDVLSFSTAVDVALGRGARVWPTSWRDDRAAALAERLGAHLAVGRLEVDAAHPWSLSPASLRRLGPGEALVLPSPNGSHLSDRAAAAGAVVFTACLRNAHAVAAAVPADSRVLVLAAGERWPDGSLRPALEDALGAGAVLHHRHARRPDGGESPDARWARAGYEALAGGLADLLRACPSGRELLDAGFAEDVEIAAQGDASRVVPRLVDGCFVDAASV